MSAEQPGGDSTRGAVVYSADDWRQWVRFVLGANAKVEMTDEQLRDNVCAAWGRVEKKAALLEKDRQMLDFLSALGFRVLPDPVMQGMWRCCSDADVWGEGQSPREAIAEAMKQPALAEHALLRDGKRP